MHRLGLASTLVLTLVTSAAAMPVVGKVELPAPPERPAPPVRGFVERIENPRKGIQLVNPGPYLLVVLENDSTKSPESPGQVKWELVGDSFSPPVLGAPSGAQVVIKNTSNTARTLVALEDAKLIQTGLINPKIGERPFNVGTPSVFTITDKDAPHLIGRVVVVATPYIAHVDVTTVTPTGATGKFEFGDVPEGTYKLRIFYKDHWLDQTETVTVPAKGKSHEVTLKITAYQTTEKKK